jgi:hypothetical protein
MAGWPHLEQPTARCLRDRGPPQGGLSQLLDCPGPEGRGDRDKEGRYHRHRASERVICETRTKETMNANPNRRASAKSKEISPLPAAAASFSNISPNFACSSDLLGDISIRRLSAVCMSGRFSFLGL